MFYYENIEVQLKWDTSKNNVDFIEEESNESWTYQFKILAFNMKITIMESSVRQRSDYALRNMRRNMH